MKLWSRTAGSFFSDPFCLSVKYVVIDVGGSGGEPTSIFEPSFAVNAGPKRSVKKKRNTMLGW